MGKGLRFFDDDVNNISFDGTVTASSGQSVAEFAFDGLRTTKWLTSGEGSDGDSVTLEMDYGFNRTIDSIFVYKHNIDDILVATWNGSSWDDVTSSNATIVEASDGDNYFAKLNSAVTTQKVRITGSNTLTADQEKFVTMFLAFSEIGQLNLFPEFKPGVGLLQNRFQTTDGRGFVIERGQAFSALISPRSHVNQADIDIFRTLIDRKEPFYIWPSGGDMSLFTYTFEPYRFEDIYKVAIVGGRSPEYTKGYYKAGYNDTINIVEVA